MWTHKSQKKELEYLGHIMTLAKYNLLRLLMQSKIKGKGNVGRRRIAWLSNLNVTVILWWFHWNPPIEDEIGRRRR